MSMVNVTLALKNAHFKRELDTSRAKVRQFKSEVSSGANVMAGFGRALASLGIGAAVRQVVDYADNIDDLSRRFGVGAESLQRWGKLADQNGSSINGVAGALKKLTQAREGALAGDDALVKTFERLGVSVDDLRAMNVDEVMAKIGSGSMNAADMVKVLGKEALALRPTLEAAAEGGLGKMSAMSAEAIQTLGAAKDEMVGFASAVRDRLGEALAWVIGRWREFNRVLGATSAAMGAWMSGDSWRDAWGSAQKALRDLREQDASPTEKARRDFDNEEERQRAAEKAQADLARAEADVIAKHEAMQSAIEEAQVKQSDAVQLTRWDRLKLTAGQRHALERQDRRDERLQARADARFARRYGDEELKRLRELRDPVKQAERAHKAALAASEAKLEEIRDAAKAMDRNLQKLPG